VTRVAARTWMVVVPALLAGVSMTAQQPPVTASPGGVVAPRDIAATARGRIPATRLIPVGTAVVSGIVTAADTGRPVRGARVSIAGSTITAAALALRGMPMGTLTATNGVTSATSLVGVPVNPVGGGLAVGSLGARAGALPTVAPSLGRMVITDEQGRFTFPRMPAGQFTLNVTRSQFLPFGSTTVSGCK